MEWTFSQEYELRRDWWRNEKLSTIAFKRGVTPAAISNKARKMGLPKRPTDRRKLTDCPVCYGRGEVVNSAGIVDACRHCAMHAEADFQTLCAGEHREAAE